MCVSATHDYLLKSEADCVWRLFGCLAEWTLLFVVCVCTSWLGFYVQSAYYLSPLCGFSTMSLACLHSFRYSVAIIVVGCMICMWYQPEDVVDQQKHHSESGSTGGCS